jgi:hypothetical protein
MSRKSKVSKIKVTSEHAFRSALLNPFTQQKTIAELKRCPSLIELVRLTTPLTSSVSYSRALWGSTIQFNRRAGRTWSPIPKDLESELRWFAACLHSNCATINSFLPLREELSQKLLEGEAKTAEALLDNFETNYGFSIWGIEVRNAINLSLYETEICNSYINGILEDEFNDGTIKVFTRYYALHSNPESSAEYLLNMKKSRTPWFSSYLGLRLDPFIAPNQEHLISCLRRESRFSIFYR